MSNWSVMLNGYYDLPLKSAAFRPFVGAGVGLMRTSIAFGGKLRGIGSDDIADYAPGYSIPDDRFGATNDGSTDPAVQLLGGASFKLSPRVSVDLTYRYLKAFNLGWTFANPETLTPNIGKFESDLEAHSVALGLRWAFGTR
jgi:opacity protein-like surface antigen